MRDATLPRLKVCGVRAIGDVAGALALGLDAVGFVAHASSPRAVDPLAARAIVRELPPSIMTVAVFVDARPSDVRAWLAASGACAVQLCGREDPREWNDFGVPVLRRIGVAPGAELEIEAWRQVAHGFVLDDPRTPGGSGRPVDLALARELCALAPCLLAGGLDAHNVGERLSAVRAHGVDASSRLEASLGVKDPERVLAFVRAARAALSELERDNQRGGLA